RKASPRGQPSSFLGTASRRGRAGEHSRTSTTRQGRAPMELALLVLRLVVGLTFAAHGAQKLFGAFGGPGLDGTGALFERLGLCPGKLHARLAATAEVAGGLLVALGLLAPFGAAALIGTMTAAVLTVHLR